MGHSLYVPDPTGKIIALATEIAIQYGSIGISSIVFKETLPNGDNVYTINLVNGSSYDFTVPKGDASFLGIFDSLSSLETAHPSATPDQFGIIVTNTGASLGYYDGQWKVIILSNSGDLKALIKFFGEQDGTSGYDGRIRFDQANGHWYFEVRQPSGEYISKLEVGGSIIVDVVRIIKGEKPTNIPINEIALYNKEITLPDGSATVRPEIVLNNGDEYGLVMVSQQTDDVVYRRNDGTLGMVPKYSDMTSTTFTAKNENGARTLEVEYNNGDKTEVNMQPLFEGIGSYGNLDGGNANSTYTIEQTIDGGGA